MKEVPDSFINKKVKEKPYSNDIYSCLRTAEAKRNHFIPCPPGLTTAWLNMDDTHREEWIKHESGAQSWGDQLRDRKVQGKVSASGLKAWDGSLRARYSWAGPAEARMDAKKRCCCAQAPWMTPGKVLEGTECTLTHPPPGHFRNVFLDTFLGNGVSLAFLPNY